MHRLGWLFCFATPNALANVNQTVLQSQSTMPQTPIWQVFIVLALVIFMIIGLAFAFRKMGQLSFSKAQGLRVITGLSLGTRERIVLLEVGEQQILVGVSPGGMQTLHVLETPLSESTNNTANFSDHLKKFIKRGSQA